MTVTPLPTASLGAHTPEDTTGWADVKCYSVEEVAALLGVSGRHVRDECYAGELRHFYQGGGSRRKLKIRHRDLVAYLDRTQAETGM